MTDTVKSGFADALHVRDIRYFILGIAFFSLAGRALAVVIGFQIYKLTHSTMALGWLGLIEAIPAISLAPFGGYIADHFNRRRIMLSAGLVSVVCASLMAFFSVNPGSRTVYGLYAMVFIIGIARAFRDPASSAFEAQIVPKKLTVNAASWISSAWITCSIAGPAAIGFVFEAFGPVKTYLILAASFAVSWAAIVLIPSRPQPVHEAKEPVFTAIRTGWRFLFGNQPLFASMILDLFAVFFGGAMALLPVYANDILHVGARGLGLLNAAPSVGALLMTLFAARRPPIAAAGRNLLLAVAGFGVSIIVFGLSGNFYLSMAALFFSGVFDGVSMVIRRSIMRLLSPDNLRGRVASASSIFICASNELGAFESGMGASLLGTVPCVVAGGVLTLLVVASAAKFAPKLRALAFDLSSMEQKPSAA